MIAGIALDEETLDSKTEDRIAGLLNDLKEGRYFNPSGGKEDVGVILMFSQNTNPGMLACMAMQLMAFQIIL